MTPSSTGPDSVDDYISGFPVEVQEILLKIRLTIRAAVPEAEETISYQIPTFKLRGNLISFAAYKRHIGLYPAPVGDEAFNKELSAYRAKKSTVRFPLDKPIPYDLIRQIVALRVEDNLKRSDTRAAKGAGSQPESTFLAGLAAPARRALEREGITTLAALSRYSEREILQLHGMGPSTMPKLKRALQQGGLSFKQQ
jgi:uncharacterized protein YdhG (YjbR/CyaY superfamily)